MNRGYSSGQGHPGECPEAVCGLKSANYEDRLKEMDITTLEERRHQADMLYVYKVLTGREDVDKGQWYTMAAEAARTLRTASHKLNVKVNHGRQAELFLCEGVGTVHGMAYQDKSRTKEQLMDLRRPMPNTA